MNPKELFETTMDPAKRKLLRIDLTDAVEAEEMFTKLMGDEVEPRRQFIEDNALNVRNLTSRRFRRRHAPSPILSHHADHPAPTLRLPRAGQSVFAAQREDRQDQCRRGDQELVPGLLDVGHHLARAARRARRTEAVPAAHPLRHATSWACTPASTSSAPRSSGKPWATTIPTATRRSTPPWSHGPALGDARDADRRPGQLRLGRRRSPGVHAVHRGPPPHLGAR
jgi:hypothetical protein